MSVVVVVKLGWFVQVGQWMQCYGVLICGIQWIVVVVYVFLIIVLVVLLLLDDFVYLWNNFMFIV